jgi:hypothetical protein
MRGSRRIFMKKEIVGVWEDLLGGMASRFDFAILIPCIYLQGTSGYIGYDVYIIWTYGLDMGLSLMGLNLKASRY